MHSRRGHRDRVLGPDGTWRGRTSPSAGHNSLPERNAELKRSQGAPPNRWDPFQAFRFSDPAHGSPCSRPSFPEDNWLCLQVTSSAQSRVTRRKRRPCELLEVSLKFGALLRTWQSMPREAGAVRLLLWSATAKTDPLDRHRQRRRSEARVDRNIVRARAEGQTRVTPGQWTRHRAMPIGAAR